jgi:hypothetical protein
MNTNEFKLRASAGGKLATAPRNKNETLSETTKVYLKEWLIEQSYGVKKEIQNKYIERGLSDEDLAIEKAIEDLNLPFVLKNEERFEDDFFTGTPDLILDDCVLDIKTSWSCFTFPIFETEIPTKDYFYQLQIYMHLLNVSKAKLVYVLLDNEMINHFYGDECKRVKVFEVDYDPKIIEDLKEKVKEARIYLNSLI